MREQGRQQGVKEEKVPDSVYGPGDFRLIFFLKSGKTEKGPIAQFRSERTPDKREVVGSIPTRPTSKVRGCSSVGRAPALHAGGHRFESVHLHQISKVLQVWIN